MGVGDLRSFLRQLEERSDLHRVPAEADPFLEIAAITDRVCKSADNRALLFERVTGSRFPVATNIYGSRERVRLALGGIDPEERGKELARLLRQPDASPADHQSFRPYRPPIVADGPCREVTDEVPDLTAFPFLQAWPGDGGRFITLPLVFTRDPETGETNCGIYRMPVLGPREAGIAWYPDRGGARHWRKYGELGKRMPVAVALGGRATELFSAMLPLPDGCDEMLFAGWLAGSPVELVRCRTNDLLVPADTELVIEGYVEPGETVSGGDFGNHTGYYAPSTEVPLLRVTAITRRHDCIVPATVVGPPPMEDCFLAEAAWRLLLPLIRQEVPEVVDLRFPYETIFQAAGIVTVRAGDATGRDIVRRIWQSPWLRTCRLLVLLDADTAIDDLSRVFWHVVNRVDWSTDLLLEEARPAGTTPWPWGNRRAIIDATRKARTPTGAPWPREIMPDEETRNRVDARWQEYGFPGSDQ